VIDVVSFGGETKEFHIDLDPNKLIAFNVSVSQVMNAVAASNSNVGANYLEMGTQVTTLTHRNVQKTGMPVLPGRPHLRFRAVFEQADARARCNSAPISDNLLRHLKLLAATAFMTCETDTLKAINLFGSRSI